MCKQEMSLGNFFFSSSNFSCNSSSFLYCFCSSENSVCEIISSSEAGLGSGSTSVTWLFFPKSSCSPGTRQRNSSLGFQTDNRWDGYDKLQISKGKSNAESQNHIMAWVGKELQDHLLPASIHDEGVLSMKKAFRAEIRSSSCMAWHCELWINVV